MREIRAIPVYSRRRDPADEFSSIEQPVLHETTMFTGWLRYGHKYVKHAWLHSCTDAWRSDNGSLVENMKARKHRPAMVSNDLCDARITCIDHLHVRPRPRTHSRVRDKVRYVPFGE